MNLSIHQEELQHYQAVFNVIKEAFRDVLISDQSEPFLVERLRKSEAFIPDLSLIALVDDTVVGHILLTKIKIIDVEKQFDSLALAPVSVIPEYQQRGIGTKLIYQAHDIARNMGHTSIVLIGHEAYYPKFGYKQAHTFGITLPFEAPKENCMAIELIPNALQDIKGVVRYPKEFSE